ncbi:MULTISPECIES: hypothetical protein [unclassified Pseudoalteromonas]|uniref:hypothetical protein n=1 Tax=unclassified Pseudoalteromonas TaxID=194690 RepID=UPI0023590673|nr:MULTISPECIES: hypothetical protein [unclassified Pseudoalteromonas]MDC9502331.1 hypothetical protein [Pseudoalteromonas sp. Angola-18]MDC9527988.1 hypothetical protein [Pseudoalteromonas sp. Angola-7]
MSDEWIDSSLKSMKKSKKDNGKNKLGKNILKAIKLKKPKVTKLVIEAEEVNVEVIGGVIQPLPKEE